MTYKLDMTMMFAMHDALRRELERIARVAARPGDDPRQALRTAVGWELFKTFLLVHHTAEDLAIWPVMRRELSGDDLLLLDAMESEHAAIDPLLESMDAALTDREHGLERLGGLVDALVTKLGGHLRHEESEGLPLIDATLTEEQWRRFGEVHRERVGADGPRYLPWVLDGRDPAPILGRMPAAIREAYRDEWRPAYDRLTLYP
ncbi:hemerythrin domain-containing protein [Nonomuraea sp. LPB2021202275-12-8]|uniref:hemerythrin domain-containing protein n=1 Tax=Nonomuraea sp. LPB2021202275-12-8 TaxID=3120159 RepID=UPI00300CAA99